MREFIIAAIKKRDWPTICVQLKNTPRPLLEDMDGLGTTVTHLLAGNNLPQGIDLMQELLPHTLTKPNQLKVTPMLVAIYSNQVEMVLHMEAKKIDRFCSDTHRAAFFNEIPETVSREEAIKQDSYGNTPLVVAFCAGHSKSIIRLLKVMRKEEIHRDVLLNITINNKHLHLLANLMPYITISDLNRYFPLEEIVLSFDTDTVRENLLTNIERRYDQPAEVLKKILNYYPESSTEYISLFQDLIKEAAVAGHVKILKELFQMQTTQSPAIIAGTLIYIIDELTKVLTKSGEYNQFNIRTASIIAYIAKEYTDKCEKDALLHNRLVLKLCESGHLWVAKLFSDEVCKNSNGRSDVSVVITQQESKLTKEQTKENNQQRDLYRRYIKALVSCDSIKKAQFLETQLLKSFNYFKSLTKVVKASYVPIFIADMWDSLKQLTDNDAKDLILKMTYNHLALLIEEKFQIHTSDRQLLANLSDYFRAMKYSFYLGLYDHCLIQIGFVLHGNPFGSGKSVMYPGSVAQYQLSMFTLHFLHYLKIEVPDPIRQYLNDDWDGELDSYLVGVPALMFCGTGDVTLQSLQKILSALENNIYPRHEFIKLTKQARESYAFIHKVRDTEATIFIFIRWLDELEKKIAPDVIRENKFIQSMTVSRDNIAELKKLELFYGIKKACYSVFCSATKELKDAASLARISLTLSDEELRPSLLISSFLKILKSKITAYESILNKPISTPFSLEELKEEAKPKSTNNIPKKPMNEIKSKIKEEDLKADLDTKVERIESNDDALTLPTCYPDMSDEPWIKAGDKPKMVKPIKVIAKVADPVLQVAPRKPSFSKADFPELKVSVPQVTSSPNATPHPFYHLLPPAVPKFIKELSGETFVVGGAVRNICLGKPPKDIDLCTTSSMDEILTKFPTAEVRGVKKKSIRLKYEDVDFDIVVLDKTKGAHLFDWLRYNLLGRDFTINTMCFSFTYGFVDLLFGLYHLLATKTLVAPYQDPKIFPLEYDPIRLIRGIRFEENSKVEFDDYLSKGIKNHKQAIINALFSILSDRLQEIYDDLIDEFKLKKAHQLIKDFDRKFDDFGLFDLLQKRGIIKTMTGSSIFATKPAISSSSVTERSYPKK